MGQPNNSLFSDESKEIKKIIFVNLKIEIYLLKIKLYIENELLIIKKLNVIKSVLK